MSLNLYTYVHNNPLTHIDPTGHYCVSADGKNAHGGDCELSTSIKIAEDPDVHDAPRIEDGVITGVVNPTSPIVSTYIGNNYNYWAYHAKPTVNEQRKQAQQTTPLITVSTDLNSTNAKLEFDGDFAGAKAEYKAFAGGFSITSPSTGVITKIEFSAGVAEVGVSCDKNKCFVGGDISVADITIGVFTPILDTGYYLGIEGGVMVGAAAKAEFRDGMFRFKVGLEGGFSGGIGITPNP